MHRGDRLGSSHYRHSRGPSWLSDDPLTYGNPSRGPSNLRSAGAEGHYRSLDSPPSRSPGRGGRFRPLDGPSGFGFDSHPVPPHSGQKRGFPFSGRGGSPDRFDGRSFAKLYVGSVPRTATEEDIRPLFEEHGNVLEVALIKDRKAGQQQGYCFIKYATSEEADQAIRALHKQHTLPGGVCPIQVRYADAEQERLGATEYKLFVGSLNKQATVEEVEEIFSKYGQVEDVCLLRDEKKQSRGRCFVKYSHRDMALAAINALNGIYTMKGCDQPLTVRFADPKRPRQGDSRGPAFPRPGLGPRFEAPDPGPPSYVNEPKVDRIPPFDAWRPMHPLNMGSSSNIGPYGVRPPLLPRSSGPAMPMNPGVPASGFGAPMDGPFQGNSLSSMSQQELPCSLHLYHQAPMPSLQTSMSLSSVRQVGQPQPFLSRGPLPILQVPGMNGQLPASQHQTQQNLSSAAMPRSPLDVRLQSNTAVNTANQQRLPALLQQQQQPPLKPTLLQQQQPLQPTLLQQQQPLQPTLLQQQPLQPLQQSPSQLAQMWSQQTQTLQASFHSSHHAFSQIQQVQMMQPSCQELALQQNAEAAKKQSQSPMIVPQSVASNPAAAAAAATDLPSSAYASATPTINQNVALSKCNWTEHISPEGFKYYYNSVTHESRWEKPEELTLSERQKQQQMPTFHQSQSQLQPPALSALPVPQSQQVLPQGQVQILDQVQQQMQQPSVSSEVGYIQSQTSSVSVGDPPAHVPHGFHGSQGWTLNKPAGNY
ncbi:flowering time control protein FCA-like isoform X2 [Prosopis cineraria]|uniref:flowering time control protein FCA-like isoform X2 n=1 Tax=Prosopis cineraria TaxID=364024 RepID=UPI00240F7505|nr:flowering time control protein FCA-like isoform X2 [Prosopis cineraria]